MNVIVCKGMSPVQSVLILSRADSFLFYKIVTIYL